VTSSASAQPQPLAAGSARLKCVRAGPPICSHIDGDWLSVWLSRDQGGTASRVLITMIAAAKVRLHHYDHPKDGMLECG